MPTDIAAPPRGGNQVQLIVFRLADEEFAVSIGEVREVVRSSYVTPVPGSPDFIKGIINVRGDMAVVLDLKSGFGVAGKERLGPKHLVITAQGKNLFAFEVDEVTEILRISADDIKPPPETAAKTRQDYVTGFVMRNNRLVVLLDLMKMLSEKPFNKLAELPHPRT